MRRLIVLAGAALMVLAGSLPMPALAVDNEHPVHYRNYDFTWAFDSASPPDRSAIRNAFRKWPHWGDAEENPINEPSDLMVRYSDPLTDQQRLECRWNEVATLGCVWHWHSTNVINHIEWSFMYFNPSASWLDPGDRCNPDLIGPQQPDIAAVALHEWGHMGFLNESGDPAAVMYGVYACKHQLTQHDKDSASFHLWNHTHSDPWGDQDGWVVRG